MRLIAVLSMLLCAMPAWAQAPLQSTPPAPASAFTTAQREELVRLLREAFARDPGILRDGLAALQADEARRADKVTRDVLTMMGPRLVDAADPVLGNPMGDVVVIEFYDTRCPYCRRMKPVVADLLRTDRRLKVVVKDLPVLGPSSQLESRALLAVQRQGGYFKMQEAVMATGGTSTRDSLRDMADRLGLDGGRMLRDMDDPVIKARLEANVQLAREIGIEGTPAFVIGQRLIGGAVELKELQAAVVEARGGAR